MRFNVYGPAALFSHSNQEVWCKFEKYLAAAGGIVMYDREEEVPKQIDIEVKSIPTAHASAQYVLDDRGQFLMAQRSSITIEVDHIEATAVSEARDEMLAFLSVALIHGVCPPELVVNPNCWSKKHGSRREDTGWSEGDVPFEVMKMVMDATDSFFDGNNAEDVYREYVVARSLMRVLNGKS